MCVGKECSNLGTNKGKYVGPGNQMTEPGKPHFKEELSGLRVQGSVVSQGCWGTGWILFPSQGKSLAELSWAGKWSAVQFFSLPGNSRDGNSAWSKHCEPKNIPEKQLCLAGNKNLLEGVSVSAETHGPVLWRDWNLLFHRLITLFSWVFWNSHSSPHILCFWTNTTC